MASILHHGKAPHMDATQRFVTAMLILAAILAVTAFITVNVL